MASKFWGGEESSDEEEEEEEETESESDSDSDSDSDDADAKKGPSKCVGGRWPSCVCRTAAPPAGSAG
jgi:hypothetical protein